MALGPAPARALANIATPPPHHATAMDLDIGAKRPIHGDHVFVVGQFLAAAEPAFVLLYDPTARRRAKRNIQKRPPTAVIEALGVDQFTLLDYPRWGTVWLRTARIRAIRALTEAELAHSADATGSMVLFQHDPTPEDEHAGFLLFGMAPDAVARLLNTEFLA
jgi:hypothetical protein